MDEWSQVDTSGKRYMDFEHVLVAGGGSGGHVFPALAVAEQLVERGWRMSWLGRHEGLERELLENRGLAYHALPARAIVGRSLAQRAVAAGGMGISAIRARGLIRRIHASVVLGTGGFVSAAGVMGAGLAGCPVVLLEPNVVPGAANRWLSRWAKVAAVATPETARHLRCPVEETGVPIRSEFAVAAPPPPLDGPLRLLVLGGSQGARRINEIVPVAIERLAAMPGGVQVTHQAGGAHVEQTRAAYERCAPEGVELSLVPFLEDVQGAMSRAHLIISRAGAITLAEICAVGRASLLLPLSLAGAHQSSNARRLVKAGAAAMVEPEALSAERFVQELVELAGDRRRLQEMAEAASSLARPQATAEIASLIERVVGV